jgi:hypothetical protein
MRIEIVVDPSLNPIVGLQGRSAHISSLNANLVCGPRGIARVGMEESVSKEVSGLGVMIYADWLRPCRFDFGMATIWVR